ncbi:MAG TPA: transposase [Clostridiales bacterium]|mgnify:CR=1 FL=1|nr:transposase [Clostridiales bacterium]
MARPNRKKSPEGLYHVMSRSISEINLYQTDEDKDHYLQLLKRYKEEYHCSIYSYILMDTHVHIYINTCGADISKFMLCLNTAYVIYYNRKHQRHGHLFGGRFASFIVDNETYSLTLSAYIHNNAKDLPGYRGKEELYPYSSYGIYTGHRDNTEGIVDTDYLLKHFSSNKKAARKSYRAFSESMCGTGIMKEIDDNIIRAYTENNYRSEKSYIVRNEIPDELLAKIQEIFDKKISAGLLAPEGLTEELTLGLSVGLKAGLRLKYSRGTSNIRAFITYTLRILCGYSYKQLCEYIGNMSLSGISKLSNKGFRLFKEHTLYQNAFNALIGAIWR